MSSVGSRPTAPVAIGIDFGTESGRVLALDLRSGEELGGEAVAYTHGVIDAVLPGSDVRLAADWALQDPADWLRVVRTGVPAALESGGIDPARVVGLGIDCTSCTVLPTLADGTPLSE